MAPQPRPETASRAPRHPIGLTDLFRMAMDGIALPPGDLERLIDRIEGAR